MVDKEAGRVTDEIHYLTADEEEMMTIAQANEPLDSEGCFVNAEGGFERENTEKSLSCPENR